MAFARGAGLRRAGALLLLCLALAARAAAPVPASPQRIVSLVPSLTEAACALGARERLVGRSRYCLHPASVRSLPELGGYLDPAWEHLVALRPDLVLLTQESRDTRRRLEQLGLPVLSLSQDRLEQVLTGFAELGRALGRPGRGRALEDSLRRGLEILRGTLRPRGGGSASGPRVLLVADRSPAAGAPRDLWVIGRGSWLSDLLDLLGARNAVAGLAPSLPMFSREGLQQVDPDWILELWAAPPAGRTLAELEADWRAWPELRAVARGHVRALGDERLVVPGPRLLEAAALLREALEEPSASSRQGLRP